MRENGYPPVLLLYRAGALQYALARAWSGRYLARRQKGIYLFARHDYDAALGVSGRTDSAERRRGQYDGARGENGILYRDPHRRRLGGRDPSYGGVGGRVSEKRARRLRYRVDSAPAPANAFLRFSTPQ